MNAPAATTPEVVVEESERRRQWGGGQRERSTNTARECGLWRASDARQQAGPSAAHNLDPQRCANHVSRVDPAPFEKVRQGRSGSTGTQSWAP